MVPLFLICKRLGSLKRVKGSEKKKKKKKRRGHEFSQRIFLARTSVYNQTVIYQRSYPVAQKIPWCEVNKSTR